MVTYNFLLILSLILRRVEFEFFDANVWRFLFVKFKSRTFLERLVILFHSKRLELNDNVPEKIVRNWLEDGLKLDFFD